MNGRPASRPSRFISCKTVPCNTHTRARTHAHAHIHTHTHIRNQGRQQSSSGRFGKDRRLPLPRIEPRFYSRLTARSLITIPIELFPLVAEQDPVHTEDEQNNGNTTQYRNKTVCVGCTEGTSVVSTFPYSFVYLHCAVPVSMNYTLCLIRVRIKVLSNFQRGQTAGARFAGETITKLATLLGASRAAVPIVRTSHTDHGKTS